MLRSGTGGASPAGDRHELTALLRLVTQVLQTADDGRDPLVRRLFEATSAFTALDAMAV